jgi:cell division ATPase FtsA
LQQTWESFFINISIAKEARLYFSRDVAYGSRDIIKDISWQLGISVEEAERLIKEKGVPEVDFDLSNKVAVSEEIMRQKFEAGLDTSQIEAKKEVNLLELRMLWQSHIERITQELRRSLAFHKEQSEGARVEYIYFLGGGSQVKNLITVLSSQIGGECQTLLPFMGMQISKDRRVEDGAFSSPIFVNAANLALNVLEKDRFTKMINFLPLELKKKEVVLARRFVLRITGILLIFLFGIATLHTLLNQQSIKINISGIDFKLNRVKVVVERLNYLNEQTASINQRSAQIVETLKERKNFLLPLKDLAKILPREILLTKLTISKGGESKGGETGDASVHADIESSQVSDKAKYQIKIEAEIFSTYEQATNIMQEFKKRLESINYFTNINITPLKLEKISVQDLKQTKDLTLPSLRKFSLTAKIE